MIFAHIVAIDNLTALGVGRPTTIRPEVITRASPHLSDPNSLTGQAAGLMRMYGPLVTTLNLSSRGDEEERLRITRLREDIKRVYENLPESLQWTTEKYVIPKTNKYGLTSVISVFCLTETRVVILPFLKCTFWR